MKRGKLRGMTQAAIIESLPPPVRKHVDPASPLPVRTMASKGMVPLAPRDMVLVLCGLSLDADAQLAANARTSLTKLPDKLLQPALDTELPSAALGVLGPQLLGRDDLLEKVVVNRLTPDASLATFADQASARIVEILAENQERCMRSEALVRAIRVNPNILRSSIDRLFDFLVRAGIIYDEMPEFAESLARLSPAEIASVADKVVLPSEVAILLVETAPTVATPTEAPAAESAAAAGEAEKEDDPVEVQKKMPTLKIINGLNAAQKMALALKGNKEARSILVRDSNRLVATATIKNPRVTEQEVIAVSKSRSVNDEVIRIICNSKEMTRSYGVKLALVNNPKTPLQTALRFLGLLRQNDLKQVAKSKNVASTVSLAAKKMVQNKSSGT